MKYNEINTDCAIVRQTYAYIFGESLANINPDILV